MNRPTRYLLQSILLGLLSLPLNACALSGDAVEGKVLEEGTNKPISGAIVVVRWQGYVSIFPAETRNVCVHVASTTTDDQGRYHFPAWHKEAHIKGVKDLKPNVTAHQAGYQWSERYAKNVQYLQPSSGGREERLEYLQKISRATGCHFAGESEKNLLLLRKALYEEAERLAKAKEYQKTLEDLLYSKEIIEFGYEAAQKRHLERLKAQK